MLIVLVPAILTALSWGQAQIDFRDLNAEEIANLRIGGGGTMEMTPASTARARITGHHLRTVPIGMSVDVKCKVQWSIQPAEGVRLDASTGDLTVSPGVRHGTVYTLAANVENGRRIIRTTLHVYTREANPFAGYWREKAEDGILELVFGADGKFRLTRRPFEVYTDYWGDYTFDLKKGTLELKITYGNFVPEDFIPKGRFRIGQGVLTMEGIYLGTWTGQPKKPAGHVFVKTN